MKTYYTVEHNIMWRAQPETAWFDDHDEAYQFSQQDYTDKPVAHVATKAATIKKFDELVRRTKDS